MIPSDDFTLLTESVITKKRNGKKVVALIIRIPIKCTELRQRFLNAERVVFLKDGRGEIVIRPKSEVRDLEV